MFTDDCFPWFIKEQVIYQWVVRNRLKEYGRLHRLALAGLQISSWRFAAWKNLRWLWYALKLETCSFVGRTRILLSKKEWGVNCGPCYEEARAGCFVENRRTNARIEGILDVTNDYPWANMVDQQIFLRGFDAGEQFALHPPRIPEMEPCSESPRKSPFQAASNSLVSQTRSVIPAAIAGVTRNDECTRTKL